LLEIAIYREGALCSRRWHWQLNVSNVANTP
jgi:hypothetical protein